MPHGRFVPPQNFNRPIGFPSKKKPRVHRAGGKSSSDNQGVRTNHGAGVPQRKIV